MGKGDLDLLRQRLKPGDMVKILDSKGGVRFGVIIQSSKKMYMVGEVYRVLVEGEVEVVLKDRVRAL